MSENKEKKYKVSILGDSISTYFGFTDFDYPIYYTEVRALINGIKSVDDIWWKQVIEHIGGELCVNNSYSGSLVTGESSSSACSKERCTRLSNESFPDIVLIYIGTNDRGELVSVGNEEVSGTDTFYGAYRVMLRRIKENYPEAKIFCGTLLFPYREGSGEKKQRGKLPIFAEEINNAIKFAANKEGCLVADLASYNEQYETLEYCHPTKAGHKTIATLWLKALKNLI